MEGLNQNWEAGDKYFFQMKLVQRELGLTTEDMEALSIDHLNPHATEVNEWVEKHAAELGNALANTPEKKRRELFDTFHADPDAAVTTFLSAHPELQDPDKKSH